MNGGVSRRSVLITGAAAAAGLLGSWASAAPEPAQHGASTFGDLRYPPGFQHFDYVNPRAPKGGTVRFARVGSFDSFNYVIPRGTPPAGFYYIYDSLLRRSLDEPDSCYGLLARSVSIAGDQSRVTFQLRREARWHDGQPVTAADVLWTVETMRTHSPAYALSLTDVEAGDADGEHAVSFHLRGTGGRHLALMLSRLLILPKHWWTSRNASGELRDISDPTLEPPLGSGPYAIADFSRGRHIRYRRVRDYWAADLPVCLGSNNFDAVEYQYYRDETIGLEAFKADNYDFRFEDSAKNWSTGYRFPARTKKQVVLETFPEAGRGVMEGLVPNHRRRPFADTRVRQALNHALDFEQMNRTLFHGQYQRIDSYFYGTELASTGAPEPGELALLEKVRGQVPPEVFSTPFRNPTGGTSQRRRANLREATNLLKAAGYSLRNRVLVEQSSGKPLRIEFLLFDPAHVRIVLFYRRSLSRLGIGSTVKLVDSATYLNRLRNFDFDLIIYGWIQSLTPGIELDGYWGSAAAEQAGTRNVAGIRDPAVDALIQHVVKADSRARLITATRALDRVLLWNHYLVPTWAVNYARTARWDRFGRPDALPRYWHGFPDIWWYDAERANRIG